MKKLWSHQPPSLKGVKEEWNGDISVKLFGENPDSNDGEQISSQAAGNIVEVGIGLDQLGEFYRKPYETTEGFSFWTHLYSGSFSAFAFEFSGWDVGTAEIYAISASGAGAVYSSRESTDS